jgi:hypothetical protein
MPEDKEPNRWDNFFSSSAYIGDLIGTRYGKQANSPENTLFFSTVKIYAKLYSEVMYP